MNISLLNIATNGPAYPPDLAQNIFYEMAREKQ